MRQLRDILIFMKYIFFILLFSNQSFSKDITCDQARKILSTAFQNHYSVHDTSPDLIEKAILHYVERRDPNNVLLTEAEFNKIKQDAKKYKNKYRDFFITEPELALRLKLGAYYIAPERCLFLSKAFNLIEDGKERYKQIFLRIKDEKYNNLKDLKKVENLKKRLRTEKKLVEYLEKSFRYLKQSNEIKSVEFYLREDKEVNFFEDALNSILLVMDNHSVYLNNDFFKSFDADFQRTRIGFGIIFSTLDNKKDFIPVLKVIENSATSKTIIEKDDEVIEVNGKSVSESGYYSVIEEITKRAKVAEPTIFKVRSFIDKKLFPEFSDIIEVSITPEEFSQEKIISRVIKKNENIFLHIKLADFYDKSSSDFQEEYFKLKSENPHSNGIILDLRNNTGGLVDEVLKISSLFLGNKLVLQVDNKDKKENEKVYSSNTQKEIISFFNTEDPLIKEKVIVLTDTYSASASEILAGILKSYNRALIVGDKHTFGKGTIQYIVPYREHGLGALKISRSVYFLADGKTPQFNGISSDIILPSITSFSDVSERKYNYTLKPKNKFENLIHDNFKNHDKKILKKLIKNSKKRIKSNKDFDKFLSKKSVEKYIESEDFKIIDPLDPVLDESVNILNDLMELTDDY